MALATYDDLVSAIKDWDHRGGDEYTARVPDFIRLAEAQINRRLVIEAKELEVPLTTVVGSRFVPLPGDFGSPIGLWSPYVQPRYEFIPLTAAQLDVKDTLAALPVYWAIDGSNIAFNCTADREYPLYLRYLQTLYLSSTNQTNALFAHAPDLYLYGALAHSAPYTRDSQQVALWEAKFRSLLLEVAAEGSRDKGMAPLQTEIPAILLGSRNSRRGWRY